MDSRDGRPCNYPGRLLIHPSLRDKVWQNIALLKTGRTNACEMLHSRDMVAIEDVSPDALPATVDENDSTVQGAQKYQQDSLFAKILLSLCHTYSYQTRSNILQHCLCHVSLFGPCSLESQRRRNCSIQSLTAWLWTTKVPCSL